MSPNPSLMRWNRVPGLLALLLAGCATLPAARPPLDADQQRDQLQGLADFSFTGRVAIDGQDSTPSMEWRQRRDVARIRLISPLGVGGLRVEYSPGRLRLENSSGVKLDSEAEQLLAKELGFVPPFDSLRYWVLGLPAPGSTAVQIHDADGWVQQLDQQGWTITYRRSAQVQTALGSLRLPALLTATRGELGLRLVIDRWRIK